MAVQGAMVRGDQGVADAVAALVHSSGTGSHPHVRALLSGEAAPRDLSDAIHFICLLHGRHPGVLDYVAEQVVEPRARPWIADAAAFFEAERGFIARLVAAAGPLPSTPGQAGSEAAVAGQRHALDMLAQSHRAGCAVGAAAALVLDWHSVSRVLERAALGFAVPLKERRLPEMAGTLAMIESLDDSSAMERALFFGAQQLLAQQRGLWGLLEARASARAAS